MAAKCLSRSARTPMTTMPTITRRMPTARISWILTRMAAEAGLRVRHSQRGGHCDESHHGRIVGVGERARRPRRQFGAGLHYACTAWRVLRLAMVLHGRAPGSAAATQASGTAEQSDHARRAATAAQRVPGDDLL